MMIKTAGGPGLVSPIDFNERKGKGLSRSSWIAIGVVAAAHMAVGAGLYYQRFELATRETPVIDDGIKIDLIRPTPKPPEPAEPVEAKPRPENPNLHNTPAPTQPTDVVTAADSDVTPIGDTITLSTTVEHPVPDAKPVPIPTPEPPRRVITNPDWASRPTGDQLMRAYPDRALTGGVAGVVSMNCLVEASGRVSDCNVTQETPGSYGFGRAAGGLARYFRMSPRTVNGAAEGSRVNITLRFVPPAD